MRCLIGRGTRIREDEGCIAKVASLPCSSLNRRIRCDARHQNVFYAVALKQSVQVRIGEWAWR